MKTIVSKCSRFRKVVGSAVIRSQVSGACRGGVVYAAGIGRQIAAAMGDNQLESGICVEHAAENQVVHGDRRLERDTDHSAEIMVGKATPAATPGAVHEQHASQLPDP